MQIVENLVWISGIILIYTYLGYGVLLWALSRLKQPATYPKTEYTPSVTLVIPAFNEAAWILKKIRNAQKLDYPKDKLEIWVIADGSTDDTAEIVSNQPGVRLFYQEERRGKTAAINRVLNEINSEITVFTDANALLNQDCMNRLTLHFQDEKVGVVAGEKRIMSSADAGAATSGEGLYWKYESTLKKWDSRLYSVVGAAGELIAVRTSLLFPVDSTIIIEDFYLSMKLALQGHVTRYEPEAYAVEVSSASISEEIKRKVRISAGGLQAVAKLAPALNIFRYGILSFQYISHRALRWTLAPIGLLVLLISTGMLAWEGREIFRILFYGQITFYLFALAGYLARNNQRQWKIFYVPFYFTLMNLSVFAGGYQLLRGKQFTIWEKAMRAA